MCLGTIVWDAYHSDKIGTFANLPPHYKEYDNIYDLMDNLTHLQSMLYNPNYILVEFQGIIYNATEYGTKTGRKYNHQLNDALKNYRQQWEKERTRTK